LSLRLEGLYNNWQDAPTGLAYFISSLTGRVPTGNTGGADVPAELPMPIPADLQQLLAGQS
jgi:hypothetical protein